MANQVGVQDAILNVLVGQSLRDTLIVVIRWYGGTKLGTGGLVRAYGGAAIKLWPEPS